jgi:hypothetical protein
VQAPALSQTSTAATPAPVTSTKGPEQLASQPLEQPDSRITVADRAIDSAIATKIRIAGSFHQSRNRASNPRPIGHSM